MTRRKKTFMKEYILGRGQEENLQTKPEYEELCAKN